MNHNTLAVASWWTSAWFDYLVVPGVVALAALAMLFWTLYARKKGTPRRRHRHHHSSYREQFKKNANEIRQLVQPRRRRHSEHRPLNPTLAQTGGLPPIRDEEKSAGEPPPPSQS